MRVLPLVVIGLVAGCQPPTRDAPAVTDPCGEALVARAEGGDDSVLAHFWARWSGPGRHLLRTLEDDRVADEIRLWRIDRIEVDEEPDLVTACEVTSVPTLIAVVDGRVAGRLIGAVSVEDVVAFLEEARRLP